MSKNPDHSCSDGLRITPKGVICLALDGDTALTDKVWDALTEYGFRQCECEFEIPAIVLDDGGVFIPVHKNPPAT